MIPSEWDDTPIADAARVAGDDRASAHDHQNRSAGDGHAARRPGTCSPSSTRPSPGATPTVGADG